VTATVAAIVARMLQQRVTVLDAAVSVLIAANVVAAFARFVAAAVANNARQNQNTSPVWTKPLAL